MQFKDYLTETKHVRPKDWPAPTLGNKSKIIDKIIDAVQTMILTKKPGDFTNSARLKTHSDWFELTPKNTVSFLWDFDPAIWALKEAYGQTFDVNKLFQYWELYNIVNKAIRSSKLRKYRESFRVKDKIAQNMKDEIDNLGKQINDLKDKRIELHKKYVAFISKDET